jgi:hypothetical protein
VTDKAPEKDRDWDKEMREVDRLLSKLPYAEPGTGQRGGGAEATLRRPVAAVGGRSGPPSRVVTWARVGLGLAIGIGMTQWPYTHGCGLRLGAYLVGVAAVLVAGVWSSISSWKGRLGFAHILSELLIIWGLVLGAREVLPRVGYAKTAASWLCP